MNSARAVISGTFQTFFRTASRIEYVSLKVLSKLTEKTLSCMTSQNAHVHFKNLAANAARFLKCVSPFWDALH